MLAFDNTAWEEYLYFKSKDKKISKRIDMLLKDCIRNPFDGLGKPERLKGNLQGYYSRRITDEHRLVYRFDDNILIIASCRFHYKK
jgi:toxin YoeB